MLNDEFEFEPFEFQEELDGLMDIFESWQARIGAVKFKGSKSQRKRAIRRLNELKNRHREWRTEREAKKAAYVSKLKEQADSLRKTALEVESTRFWWEIYPSGFPDTLRRAAEKLEIMIAFYSN